MAQSSHRKLVILDPRGFKEISRFPRTINLKFKAAFELLSQQGELDAPLAKKLSGYKNLYEIRISHKNEYRAIYCYAQSCKIIILSAFLKTSQKTPQNQITKAVSRQKIYI